MNRLFFTFFFIMAALTLGRAQSDTTSGLSGNASVNVAGDTVSATSIQITGELPEVVNDRGKPYNVVGNILVSPGKTVTIKPGVRFLFKNFTGLQVHGVCIAQGTKDKPIVFTSEHDKKFGSTTSQEPAPYDWNGITVTENADGTIFEYCRIGYSLTGVNSLSEYITIKNCLFRQNGQADVIIKGSKKTITPGTPFVYQPLGPSPAPLQATAPAQKISTGKITLQATSAALIVAGCGVGIWKAYAFRQSDASFRQVNDANNTANLHNVNIVNDWQSAKQVRSDDLTGLAIGVGVALLGAVGLTMTLLF